MKYLIVFISSVVFSFTVQAQLDWTEVEIPMSDGQFLAGDIYLPPDWESGPTILVQTPYWKDLYHFVGLPMGIFFNQDEMGYAMVIVDWRGFFGSADAAYTGSPTRGEDGYDVVEWIAGQEWSDGKIGTWGPSALGRIQYQTAREQPPHLVCMVPQVASPLYEYSEYYHNGAARTEYLEQTDALGFGTSPLIYANPYYNLLWSFTENANHYPEEITIPTFMIGGWYDHNIDVMIRSFAELQTMSATDVQAQHKLLMGPWVHGGSGTAIIGSNIQGELEYLMAEGWSDSLAFAFFDYHLKDIDNGWNETPAVQYFQMGDDEWRSAPEFPVETQLNTLYLQPDFSMSTDLPSEPAELAFQYDPTDPSPTIGGPTLRIDLDQGPYDQSDLVESRDDILVFTTAELPADADVVGAIKVRLGIKTDVIDTDVAVRLCDVYPDGRSMLVNCGIYRLRFLNGFTLEAETMLIPGDAYFADITLPHTALTFKAGHRIRLDITGSNYPLYNRNMNTGGEMYPDGNGDTLVNPLVAQNLLLVNTSDINTSYIGLPMTGDYPVAVNDFMPSPKILVFPNPASAMLQLELGREMELNTTFGLYDASGKLVHTFSSGSRSFSLDVSAFESGVYTLQNLSGNIPVFEKIVIR
jgi:predicted acyl esterase